MRDRPSSCALDLGRARAARRRASHDSRMPTQASKETNFYLSKVDEAKAIDAMAERRKKRAQAAVSDEGGAPRGVGGPPKRGKKRRAAEPDATVLEPADASDELRRVCRKFKQRKRAPAEGEGATRGAVVARLGQLLGHDEAARPA